MGSLPRYESVHAKIKMCAEFKHDFGQRLNAVTYKNILNHLMIGSGVNGSQLVTEDNYLKTCLLNIPESQGYKLHFNRVDTSREISMLTHIGLPVQDFTQDMTLSRGSYDTIGIDKKKRKLTFPTMLDPGSNSYGSIIFNTIEPHNVTVAADLEIMTILCKQFFQSVMGDNAFYFEFKEIKNDDPPYFIAKLLKINDNSISTDINVYLGMFTIQNVVNFIENKKSDLIGEGSIFEEFEKIYDLVSKTVSKNDGKKNKLCVDSFLFLCLCKSLGDHLQIYFVKYSSNLSNERDLFITTRDRIAIATAIYSDTPLFFESRFGKDYLPENQNEKSSMKAEGTYAGIYLGHIEPNMSIDLNKMFEIVRILKSKYPHINSQKNFINCFHSDNDYEIPENMNKFQLYGYVTKLFSVLGRLEESSSLIYATSSILVGLGRFTQNSISGSSPGNTQTITYVVYDGIIDDIDINTEEVTKLQKILDKFESGVKTFQIENKATDKTGRGILKNIVVSKKDIVQFIKEYIENVDEDLETLRDIVDLNDCNFVNIPYTKLKDTVYYKNMNRLYLTVRVLYLRYKILVLDHAEDLETNSAPMKNVLNMKINMQIFSQLSILNESFKIVEKISKSIV
jgi:hypothetical protein